jgi:1-acyl-sn-glycerol-3-phosphate acyltransferase
MHFFPEGELYLENQQIQPFHPGAFILACHREVPIVPVTTILHQRLWRGKPTIRVGRRSLRLPPRVTVVIGKPVWAPSADSRGAARAARLMAERVRRDMQRVIDQRGGSKAISRGMMPRLGKRPEMRSA